MKRRQSNGNKGWKEKEIEEEKRTIDKNKKEKTDRNEMENRDQEMKRSFWFQFDDTAVDSYYFTLISPPS